MSAEKLTWYVARSGGIVAWCLLALSLVLGLLLSSRLLGRRASPAWILSVHRFLGGLSVIFTAVHVAAIMLDDFVDFGFAEVLIPWASEWKPGPVAWGIIAMYLSIAIELTSFAMKKLPRRLWRAVHWSSAPLFVMATVHGYQSGTDAGRAFIVAIVASMAVLALLTAARIVRAARKVEPKHDPRRMVEEAKARKRRATRLLVTEKAEPDAGLESEEAPAAPDPGRELVPALFDQQAERAEEPMSSLNGTTPAFPPNPIPEAPEIGRSPARIPFEEQLAPAFGTSARTPPVTVPDGPAFGDLSTAVNGAEFPPPPPADAMPPARPTRAPQPTPVASATPASEPWAAAPSPTPIPDPAVAQPRESLSETRLPRTEPHQRMFTPPPPPPESDDRQPVLAAVAASGSVTNTAEQAATGAAVAPAPRPAWDAADDPLAWLSADPKAHPEIRRREGPVPGVWKRSRRDLSDYIDSER